MGGEMVEGEMRGGFCRCVLGGEWVLYLCLWTF